MDRGRARQQRLHIGAAQRVGGVEARLVDQPCVGDVGRDLHQQFLGHQRRERGGRGGDVRADRGQYVVGGVVGLGGRRRGGGPVVVPDHGGAVVDEPEVAVPDEHVRVAPRAVDVVDEGVEPDDAARLDRVHLVRQRIEADRAGQVVHAEVEPAAGLEQLLDLLVGLAEPDDGVELHLHQPRDAQPQPLGQPAADDLGDQGLAALAGSGELHDVGTQVVGLDDSGERSTLLKGVT